MKAAEEEEKEAELDAAVATAAAAAEAELNRRPAQVDVSKLAHFRYSKVKVWTRTTLFSTTLHNDIIAHGDGFRVVAMDKVGGVAREHTRPSSTSRTPLDVFIKFL